MYEEFQSPPALRWDQALLAPIVEINERLLERLQAAACAGGVAPDGAGAPAAPAASLVRLLLHEWRALDAAALRRLAHCPFLLLDAGFAEPARWQRLVGLGVHEAPGGRERERVVMDADWVALARRTLLLGWHLARAQPLAARVLLGMNPASAACIAVRRLTDPEALAEGVAEVRPRWEQQPQVWRQLLQASHAAGEALRWAQLRGLQLLAGGAGQTGATIA